MAAPTRQRLAAVATPPPAAEPAPPAPPLAGADGAGRADEGHGRRLTRAFDALEAFPALAASRNRVLQAIGDGKASVAELAPAVESDVALVVGVLRLANRLRTERAGRIAGVPEAIEALSPARVEALVSRATVYDFFERTPGWDQIPERFRLHAVATQRAAGRVAEARDWPERDELLVSALLHDVGKLVLVHAYPGYPDQVHGAARTPQERLHSERRELGVDHALVGGVLARRWGLPTRLAAAIECHHSPRATGEAALISLADMLVHYGQNSPVDPAEMLALARTVGLEPAALREVIYELPCEVERRPRRVESSPLSARETEVLRRLAEGKVYKQIALELSLSTSTVRTHLHNTYAKLGAVDRAQAVLVASERGWL
jgi:HD-like signal output (HDOD) protein/DNA-binding CsgD family transcriptional regulator